VSCVKTAELIEMQSGMLSQLHTGNTCIKGPCITLGM